MQEQQLIKKAQNGDNDAFCELMTQYENRIFKIALGVCGNEPDAMDAAQDAMIRIYDSMNKYRFQSSFYTWAYRVTMNVCLDFLRKKKAFVSMEDIDFNMASRDDTEGAVLQKELSAEVRNALAQLPEKYAAVVAMKDLEMLKYDEISAILSLSEGTVKSRLFRGREKLRIILEKQGVFGNK